MMTPYEADRLFEADTARVHQFSSGVYRCCTSDESHDEFSWRLWLATRLGLAQPRRKETVAPDKKAP